MNSLVKVKALADKTDANASRCSFASASTLNSSVRSTFTNEVAFRADLKVAMVAFVKASKNFRA